MLSSDSLVVIRNKEVRGFAVFFSTSILTLSPPGNARIRYTLPLIYSQWPTVIYRMKVGFYHEHISHQTLRQSATPNVSFLDGDFNMRDYDMLLSDVLMPYQRYI
jgi:hypothetical protein